MTYPRLLQGHPCPVCGHPQAGLGVELFEQTGFVRAGGKVTRLSRAQFRVLQALLETWPRPRSRTCLWLDIYGLRPDCDTPDQHVILTVISQVRRRLREAELPIEIVTRNRVGYSLRRTQTEMHSRGG